MEQSALFGRNAWFCPPSKTEAGKLAKCLATSHSDWASQVAQVGRNPPANAGDTRDTGLIPGSGRPPGEGTGSPLHYSCLENPMMFYNLCRVLSPTFLFFSQGSFVRYLLSPQFYSESEAWGC